MAIAFDASATGVTGSGTSLTFSHTCTGSNLILVCYADHGSGVNITGVTYNGTSMTAVDTVLSGDGEKMDSFYLIAPSTGANNVVISAASATLIIGASGSYTGAKQSGQPDTHTTDSATGTDDQVDCTVTVVADNSWGTMGVRGTGAGTSSAGANTFQRAANSGNVQLYDSNGTWAAGSHTLSATGVNASSGNGAACELTIAPVVAAATGSPAYLIGV